MRKFRRIGKVVTALCWSTPIWARDTLQSDPVIAAEVLAGGTLRWSLAFLGLSLTALGFALRAHRLAMRSPSDAWFSLAIASACVLIYVPAVAYLIRYIRLAWRLASRDTVKLEMHPRKLFWCVAAYCTPIAIWLVTFVPLSRLLMLVAGPSSK
jgi:hypothetical protein